MAHPSYVVLNSTATATGYQSPAYAINCNIVPCNVAVSVVLASASAGTYSVQYTLDDLQGTWGATSVTWFDSASASSITASTLVTFTSPITATRVVCSTIPGTSSPQVSVRFLQAGSINN